MTISKDLFLSILAMDSYNRGYGAGIANGDPSDTDGLGQEGSQIGSATVIRVDGSEIAQSAGFYAVAYSTEYGTVISYRGTDSLNLGADPVAGGSDILNGWLAGAGLPTSQTDLAIEFFLSATGQQSVWQTAANTIVTGHSLGGGLAALAA